MRSQAKPSGILSSAEHEEFCVNLPDDAQTAFAIRMLFTHRPVDRYGTDMFLHYHCGFTVNFIGEGANKY